MRVLIATNTLGIGGAETHVVALARALTRLGCSVVVASTGGVYESSLRSDGIDTLTIPLRGKDPVSLMRSYAGIFSAVRAGVDVMHAHARIPAFVCDRVSRVTGVPLVTTCHSAFSLGSPYRQLSRWGARQLAVSDDLEKYLVDSYGLSPDTVSVTVNGIDSGEFYPARVRADGVRFICASRIDPDCAGTFRLLMKSFPYVLRKRPDASLLIVGDGSLANETIKTFSASGMRVRRANADEEAYAAPGEVVFAGARSAVGVILRRCGTFVGCSRSAIEAAATSLPCVICGPVSKGGEAGLFGVLTPDNFPDAAAVNFTCRSLPKGRPGDLVEAMISALNVDDDMLNQIRELVVSRYSADIMAADALRVYEEAVSAAGKVRSVAK